MHAETYFTKESASTEYTEELTIQQVSLSEIPETEPTGPSLLGNNLELIHDVKIKLTARLGDAEISVGELFSLKEGSITKLDRLATDPIDILLDGKVVARGSLVVVEDFFGISITEIPRKAI